MNFFYKAKNKDGQIIEGTMESADRFSLSRELRSRGLVPVLVSQKKGGLMDLNGLTQKLFGKVKVQEKILFTKNLSGMISAGLSLSRAVSVLKKQTKNTKLNNILTGLENEINSGGTLSSGLAKYPNTFSKLFVSMVRAGEESGNLAGSLSEVGANLEKSHSITKKVKGAMIYPSVIFTAMLIIGILMLAFVVPTLAKTFEDVGSELPSSTKFIIALGDFFSNHLILALSSLIAIVVTIVLLVKAKFMAKYIDFTILKLPAIGEMSRQLNSARTARTISSLLMSGVPITRAIEIAEDVVQNVYYKKALEDGRDSIQKGLPFSQIFVSNPKLYPVMMSEMIQVGEETGKLSDMLFQVAVFYEGEIENKTKNLSTIIEPVLMIIIGCAVGFFAVSMFSPLYSVMGNI
ncbi:MAG TPA: type II secretion system F family protein [Candidatus Paceibacterota bacterium]|mgnify:CR=1 FL=1|nr:type II secretion system F family protein [Candidatus Paceibacterota bacterium]HPT18054.1 type II secretion system F family protein [Candidatus Paceibacterota bacterium]